MTKHAVVIAGGGPTGLVLAAELALARIDVAIVERRETQDLASSRGLGLNARTVEMLDQRGVAERFVSKGTPYKVAHFGASLDTSDLPSRHNYTLGLPQKQTERILADWVAELNVPSYRGVDVTGFTQHAGGVSVELSGGRTLDADYLVGCDGGRSVVRKTMGIELVGWDASISYIIAEASVRETPPWGLLSDANGNHAIGPLGDGVASHARMVVEQPYVADAPAPTIEDLRAAVRGVWGTDFGLHDATWISRFTDAARQATSYRDRRVLIAGDAAHVHSPIGGQGLNLGAQDAMNLAWKLAQVIRGTSPDVLLETYQAERHPVAARVLKTNLAHVALRRTDARSKALHEHVAEMLKMDEPRRCYGALMLGLDLHYDLGAGHALLGRRMPDLDVVTDVGPRRVFKLMHTARPLLLNLGDRDAVDITSWADRVQRIDARYDGVWDLPALGVVPAPHAVLVRPDGYVAWVGDGTDHGLRDALTTWFGAPTRFEA